MSVLCRMIYSGIGKKRTETLMSLGFLPRHLQTKSKNKVTSYALDKYVSFVTSYTITLKKNFPAAIKFYQVFSVGLKYFKSDVMILFRAFKKVTSNGLNSLSRKELEVYYEMPKDILRTAPVLFIGSLIPGGGVIFILAYQFPKHMLTHHFWSVQQRIEFSLYSHQKKLQCYKPLFRYMKKNLSSIECFDMNVSMCQILDCLGSGVHPSVDLILKCKPLFEKFPYGLQYLPRNHVAGLLKLHNMHKGWNRRNRLYDRAHLIKLMDLAIIREGGVEILSQDEIKWNSFFRGLNPIDMSNNQILVWLRTWLAISQKIDYNSYSLLLHCPILLGFNQPSNWCFLHDKR